MIFEEYLDIYNSLGDDLSKKIYEARFKSIIYDDKTILLNEAAMNSDMFKSDEWDDFYQRFDENVPVFIYGAGQSGRYTMRLMLKFYPKVNMVGFVDSNRKILGKTYAGKKVFSSQESVSEYENAIYILSSVDGNGEIYETLLKSGVCRDSIFYPKYKKLFGFFGNQYFDLPYLKPEKDEVFVDAGSYDCSTTRQFAKWCDNNYEAVYALEPDPLCIQKCMCNIDKWGLKNVKFINKGAYSEDKVLRFSAQGMAAGKFDEAGETELEVTSIDNILEGKRASFIKMDIEGSELAALKGAEKTIRKYKPKLAICIYHKKSDLYEIPSWIMHLNMGYKLYIRHYSNFMWETVLYAIPE